MSSAPDQLFDALRLAPESAVVERSYPLVRFMRLADRLATTEGEARARLTFQDVGGVPTGVLQLRAEVVLDCQRCLGQVRRNLESTSQLAFVQSEDAPVPEDHEVIAGDPERIDLATLVEDELLLSLPLVVTHRADEDCKAAIPGIAGEGKEPRGPETRRPFAGLKDLLKH
jgi:uncharacterized protein